jgi:hypothetical protein
MTVHHNFEAESEHDIHARAREIRAGLPGQLRQQRLRTAALLYGPLCSMDELRVRIAGSIPRRFGLIRLARLESIERTEVVIPDDVLVTYAEAVDRGLFARFMIARATYYWVPQPNPWLVAVVGGSERWVAITRWHDDGPRSVELGAA